MDYEVKIQKQYYKKDGEVKENYNVVFQTIGKSILLKNVFKSGYYAIKELAENNPDLVYEVNSPDTAKEV